ncbi:MAG: anthranilate phosphoribosyltransferase, partial [Verrucomicrobiae bacterium]|nr:anthranilate phosphoribosyltransferase [Verrucomicrobiae bacterium]
ERGFHQSEFSPALLPLQPTTLDDLRGGAAEGNATVLREVLAGRDRGPRRDAILLNAAAALFVGNHARSIAEGWDQAARLIDSGKVADKLVELGRPRPGSGV